MGELTEEGWKAHPYWPFDVSTHGRVRRQSTGRLIGWTQKGRGRPGRYRQASVRPGVAPLIHVLVLETFVGPRPDGHEGDHRDRNGLNNQLSNLRWLPSLENHPRNRSD